MVRGAVTRFVTATGVMAVVVATTIGLMPAAAGAAPKPAPKPTAVQIVGAGLTSKIIVQQASQPQLFSSLLDEVGWLATAKPQTSAMSAAKLGPKYTVTVLVKNTPTQVYDLYPMASGGPRAHRAAKQPGGRKSTDGWFFGRINMSEALRVAGAPLKAKPDVIPGGIGGGIGQDINVSQIDPVAGVNHFIDEMRRLFLLNGAVLVVILFGLAGIAFLIRRRV